jgi:putative transposase
MTTSPQKKGMGLKGYDNSQPGYYFITICTKGKKNLFWEDSGETPGRPFKNQG